MPYKPLTPCKARGCPQFAVKDTCFCKDHQPKDDRPSASARGYDWQWHKASRRFLKKHPLCMECLTHKIARPATQVDHIIPVRERPDLKYVESNFQGLCATCHSQKTMRERG